MTSSVSATERVTAVVVFFRSEQSILNCVRSLCAQKPLAPKVLVVTNSPVDREIESALRALGVRLLNPSRNLGFGAACNAGAAAAADSEYLWLVNPDVECPPDALAALMPHARRGAAAAPLVQAGSGEPERSAKTVRYLHPGILLARELVLGRWLHLGSLTPPSAATRVDIVSGACLLLRMKTFCEVGGFDERFFLYGDDVDLSLKLRMQGAPLILEPAAVVSHASGTGAGGVDPPPEILRLKGVEARRAHALLLQKWRGEAAMQRYLAGLRILLHLRLVASRVAHNRAEQIRARAALDWVRSSTPWRVPPLRPPDSSDA